MLRSHGLLTYIRNTRLKTVALLFAYLLIALIVAFALSVMMAITYTPGTLPDKFAAALRLFAMEWDRFLAGALVWAGLAMLMFRGEVNRALSARGLSRNEAPRLHNIVENLAISTGLSVPTIRIAETQATNAFMAGLLPSRMSLTVTRGLLNRLDDAQLTAVIAHEFVKVVSGDARRLGLASVFTGICLYVATFIFKPFYRPSFRMLVVLLALPFYPFELAGVMAVSILAALLGAAALKLAVGKLHVYVADAGSLELTKDPGALIAAIRRVSLEDRFEGANMAVRPLMFANSDRGWFGSHPTAEERVKAIEGHAPAFAGNPGLAYPAIPTQPRDWREQFEIPAWVSGSACLVPVMLVALYCGVTSRWTSVDRNEVLALNDDIQATLAYSARVSPPETQFMVRTYGRLYEWAYGADLDLDALKRIASEQAKANAGGMADTNAVFTISSDGSARYSQHKAYIIAAALKNRTKLAKDLADAAYDCVVRWQDSELSRKLGHDWARNFGSLAYQEGFQARRFLTELEIDYAFMQTDAETDPREVFDADNSEGRAFIGFLGQKGLGSTWTANSCVFGDARKRIETWISESELSTLGVPQAEIAAMRAAIGKPEAQVPDTAALAFAQMQAMQPTAREQEALQKLRKASWNNGTKPASFTWLPALFLFCSWRLLRGAWRVTRSGVRLVTG